MVLGMNKLTKTDRARAIHLLCEGNSIRAVTRLTGFSKTTIMKLAVDAGKAASWYQDRVFRNLTCKRIQVDEIWGFVGSKAKNTSQEDKDLGIAGDAWLWVATDADTKLVPNWLVGTRDGECAAYFMQDLADRLSNRVQLTSDGHKAYLNAVDAAFGSDVDYAMLVKLYGDSPESAKGKYSPAECTGAVKTPIMGKPEDKHISTSYSERNNLTVRMHSRRMTRLTNGFSKKMENHGYAMSLHFFYYNFVRIHKTLRMTPAMAADVTDRLWEVADMVEVLEAWEAAS
jgi:IS1 family transposase